LAEEADEKEGEEKRGPRGGIVHTPGRGHATKSEPAKKKRIGKRLRQRHLDRKEQARKEWQAYDRLSEETRKLLGPKGMPKLPRPRK
jgi:hypothetical protein